LPATQANRPSGQRIPALDGVRGLAIAGVLLCHLWPITGQTGSVAAFLSSWADAGAFGVDLFFVLSGFLITRTLLNSRNSPHYFGSFYGRRVFRLFPLYYSYLLIISLLLPGIHRMVGTSMADYSGNWWWYITYFCNWKRGHGSADPNLGHFWSLAVEEQFYLIWPAVVLLASNGKRLAYVCIALIAFSFGLRCVWSLQGVDWNTLYRLTVTRFDPLAMGAIGALALQSPRWRALADRLSSHILIFGLGGFLIVAIAAGGPQWERPAIRTFGALLADAGFAGLVLFGAGNRTTGTAQRILSHRILVDLGKYSYCIYIIHIVIGAHIAWIVAYSVRRHPEMTLLWEICGFVSAVLSSFFLARLSWNYFESPVIAKGNAWLGTKLRVVSMRAVAVPEG
jgi:peptidoglycan/LPS O-acetylase OafA/YrhL